MISKTIRNQRLFVFSVLILLSVLHLFIVILNHYNYKTFAFDYGVYNFAFYDFAHFRISPVPVYVAGVDITFLQDHFSLTLVFLSPLYWILSPFLGTYTLLVIQWILIVSGGFATYRYIELKAKSVYIALAAMTFYFVLYGRFSAYHNDCNLAIMGSAMVPVFMLYFEKRNYFLTSLTFLFLILNREDFALNMFFLSALLIILHRKDIPLRNFAAILAFSSLLAFILIFKFIIPMLETEQKTFSLFNYDALGNNPLEALIYIISHPIETLSLLVKNHSTNAENDGIKLKFYLVYLISGGFVLLFRPVYLIALIPLITKKMFNDDSIRWSHEGYHGVELASLLPLLVFSIIADFKSHLSKSILSFTVLILSVSVTTYCMITADRFYYGLNKMNLFSESFYRSNYDVKEINKMVEMIPDTVVVSASGGILPHLAFRKKTFYFPVIFEATYVCLSTKDGPYPVSKETFDSAIKQLRESADWKILFESKDCLLFERVK